MDNAIKAGKYRRDAANYRRQARHYMAGHSDWAQHQFNHYTRMADECDAKASAYERGDAEAIATIEHDIAALDALLTVGR